jgi:NAD(P)-dependent dehydrogenase (short-subunit alcohol dehydrogenase family)
MARKLDGKVAVVTGASSGIGKSIVEKYVAEGAQVVAYGRNLEALREMEAANPGQVVAVGGDVTHPEDLQSLVSTPLWGAVGLPPDVLGAVAEKIAARLMPGTFGQAEDIAETSLFLASDAARNIYGQEIVVDGGYTIG